MAEIISGLLIIDWASTKDLKVLNKNSLMLTKLTRGDMAEMGFLKH